MTTAASSTLHVSEMWGLFSDHGPLVLEIRAIWPQGIRPTQPVLSRCFSASDYVDMEAFRHAVEEYVTAKNRRGYNMYATLNPLRAGLPATYAASDKDVICRRRLLIDIDRDYGKEHPATDAQIEEAKRIADAIEQYLGGFGWPIPVRVMSGNGQHLIYRLDDLPNDEITDEVIRKLLQSLKAKFSANGLSVDTTVSNASRVTKLPGTFVRRGVEIENHPYRIARIYE